MVWLSGHGEYQTRLPERLTIRMYTGAIAIRLRSPIQHRWIHALSARRISLCVNWPIPALAFMLITQPPSSQEPLDTITASIPPLLSFTGYSSPLASWGLAERLEDLIRNASGYLAARAEHVLAPVGSLQ